MGRCFYLKPSDNWAAFGSASGGSVDADYDVNWICDGAVGRPVRATSGALTVTITNASFTTNPSASSSVSPSGGALEYARQRKTVVAIVNTNVVGTVAVSGSVSGTIPAQVPPPNSIFQNTYILATEGSLSTLTLAFASNPTSVVVGEVMAGLAIELYPGPPPRNQGVEFIPFDMDDQGGDFLSVPKYDLGLEARKLTWTQYYRKDVVDELIAMYRGQRNGSRPSLLIPNSDKQDAWVGFFDPIRWKVYAGGSNPMCEVELGFTELPRSRW